MIILGLTGSLAAGKSTVAQLFRDRGIPVHAADEAVHRLYEGEAVDAVQAAFPQAVNAGRIDREKLKNLLVSQQDWQKLEAIVHPLVHRDREAFLAKAREDGARLVLFDIPLLFETGNEKLCDAVIVVSAPYEVQKARALDRKTMSLETFEALLARQMNDAEKRRRAHFVILTDEPLDRTARQVDAMIRLYAGR